MNLSFLRALHHLRIRLREIDRAHIQYLLQLDIGVLHVPLLIDIRIEGLARGRLGSLGRLCLIGPLFAHELDCLSARLGVGRAILKR